MSSDDAGQRPVAGKAHLKRWLFSIVRAVTTLVWRSVAYLCSSKEDDTMPAWPDHTSDHITCSEGAKSHLVKVTYCA